MFTVTPRFPPLWVKKRCKVGKILHTKDPLHSLLVGSAAGVTALPCLHRLPSQNLRNTVYRTVQYTIVHTEYNTAATVHTVQYIGHFLLLIMVEHKPKTKCFIHFWVTPKIPGIYRIHLYTVQRKNFDRYWYSTVVYYTIHCRTTAHTVPSLKQYALFTLILQKFPKFIGYSIRKTTLKGNIHQCPWVHLFHDLKASRKSKECPASDWHIAVSRTTPEKGIQFLIKSYSRLPKMGYFCHC